LWCPRNTWNSLLIYERSVEKSSYARNKTWVGVIFDVLDSCQTQLKERKEKKLRAKSEARSQLSKATTSRFNLLQYNINDVYT